MGSHDPIAYAYEADYHCPDCAIKRFGESERGPWPVETAEDNEGNPVGAVFPWDEWWEPDINEAQTLVCSDCGAWLDGIGGDENEGT